MAKRCFFILLIVLLAGICYSAQVWRFASMADSRGNYNGVNVPVLSQIVELVNAENCDLVIFAGDLVTGSSNSATLSSQLDNWISVMSNLNCPYYPVPGNHEIQSSDAENIWRSKFNLPTNGPSGLEELVYSFDHKNAHFIGLDSNQYGNFHRIQYNWLEADLQANTQPHVFVYAHEPAYPVGPHVGSSLDVYPSERDAFWSLLRAWKTGPYFCGHEHLYNRHVINFHTQVINGTCGAPIYYGQGGEFYHYVLVEINRLDVECWCKDNTGAVRDHWTYTVAQSATSPYGWFQPGWNLVSVPLEPEDPEASAVFDDLGANNTIATNLYRYEAGAGYAMYPVDFTQVHCGQGYWLRLDVGGIETVRGIEPRGDKHIALSNGWNLIGYPFKTAQLWSNCNVTDGAVTKSIQQAEIDGWLQATIYYYDPDTGYGTVTPDGTGDDSYVRPWYGYWMLTYRDGLELIVPKP